MPTRFRRGVRHARRGLFYTGAIVLILIAVAIAIADRLLPLVQKHPDRIAAWLIARAGRPVHFDHADAFWTSRGPVFALYNLRIGEGRQQLAVDRAELLVAMYSGMLPDHPFTELRLRGLALTVERDATGRWHFVGLAGPKEDEHHDPLQNLEGLGELQVSDAKLTVRAPDLGIAFTSPRVDLRLRVTDKRLRAGIRADAPRGEPLLAVFDFDRRDSSGTLWVGGDDIDLAPWSALLGVGGIDVAAGHGRVGVWTVLKDRRVVSSQADAHLVGLSFRGRAIPPPQPGVAAVPVAQVALKALSVTARWEKIPGGWRAEASKLRLLVDGREDVIDGLALRSTGAVTVVAPQVDAGLLLSIAALSDRVPAKLRDWLAQARPQLQLRALRIDARRGDVRGSATLDDAGWQPVGRIPALQGIAGTLRFDRDALAFDFTPKTATLAWPPAFGPALPMAFDGRLTAWRDGAAWTLESSGLHLHNDDIDVRTRIAMRFDGDGTRPRLDLFGIVGRARMLAAKRYWIRHKMPPKTIAWLDAAIEGGDVTGATAIVSGDLDDWPFLHNEGLFEIDAALADAPLHFNPEWPRAEHVGGRLSFVDNGMHFEGAGAIAGAHVPQIVVDIPDFHVPVLDIRAEATGSGAQFLALLRQSPLQKRYADTFAALDVQSEGQRATMHLVQPLGAGLGDHSVDGDVELNHARLRDSRWNLAFTDVNGRLHYDQDGVLAESLAVKLDNEPATFRLAIGKATGDASAVSAQLRGNFPAATLLQRVPALDWLKPLLAGRATWDVDVRVPKAPASGRSPPTQLVVRSDLRGVALALPAPLGKPAAKAMPLQVRTFLPASAGDIEVRLGDAGSNPVTLRGRYDDVQPFRGLVAFGGDASGALPAQGIAVGGRVPELDAAGWIAFAAGGKGGPGGLQGVDVQADALALGDSRFPNVHVHLARTSDVTTVKLDGETMAGTVTVPTDLARGIRGQFDRLYWPGSPAKAIGPGAMAGVDTDMNPTSVPPLHLDVADLRFGDAKLGHMLLQTRPIPQGLRIDQLETTAKSQAIKATGDWTRQGALTRTRLAMDFRADSLGKMLDAFGFKGVVGAGKTHAVLQAGWVGSPVAFRLAALDGTLDLDVGPGRLLEVKPGAGRVLGLVSLAELPRRLSLDFRDFFDKGFSFDSMRGKFVFAGGQARTDDLAIKGPAADIRVSGTADLVVQRYDQTIDVLPKTGGILTGVGAIAGGPIGAAVGAVAGEVFKKPLQKMGRKRYHVTGPFANPEVQAVKVGNVAAPEAAPAPSVPLAPAPEPAAG